MARKRAEKSPADIKLKQPDRAAPTEQTLLQLAEQRNLFQEAQKRQEALGKSKPASKDEDDAEGPALSPTAERILETLLWTVCLATLHFTLDVLVHHQYAISGDQIPWATVSKRTGVAWLGWSFSPPPLLPRAFPC
jgi:hypothetical protein